MATRKCPVCGSKSFYVRDPDEEYEIYEFDLQEGNIVFNPNNPGSDLPAIEDNTDTYCCKCSWTGKFQALKR
ncbi:MAG: hypothetical protein PHW74_03290 [Desulfobacca sp.]|nr:hypothetical protein [Desulfobacca sp.]